MTDEPQQQSSSTNEAMEIEELSNDSKMKANQLYFTLLSTNSTEDQITQVLKQILMNDGTTLQSSFQQFLLELCWLLFYFPSSMDVNRFINILTTTRKEMTTQSSTDIMVDDGDDDNERTKQWPFPNSSLVFIDVVSIFEYQYTSVRKDGKAVNREEKIVVSLLKELLHHNFITLNEMKVYLSNNSLYYPDLFPSSFDNKRYVILRTRIFYQQKRFNLFNEETEGYSKLVTELLSHPLDTPHSIATLKDRIQSLIGMLHCISHV
jgi:hypothetical protein